MRTSMSCAVREMRLAKSAAFSALDGTAVETFEQVFYTVLDEVYLLTCWFTPRLSSGPIS